MSLPLLPCGFGPNEGNEDAHWHEGCATCAVEYVRGRAPILHEEAQAIIGAFDEAEDGVFVFACKAQLLARDAVVLVAEIERLRAELARVKP